MYLRSAIEPCQTNGLWSPIYYSERKIYTVSISKSNSITKYIHRIKCSYSRYLHLINDSTNISMSLAYTFKPIYNLAMVIRKHRCFKKRIIEDKILY